MTENISLRMWEECVRTANMSYYTNLSLERFTDESMQDMGSRLADAISNKNKSDALSIPLRLHMSHEIKGALAERKEFLRRRLDIAIKSLKKKELWAPDFGGLEAICERLGDLGLRRTLQVIDCAMPDGIIKIADNDPLDDTAWRTGIDIAMVMLEPDVAASDAMYSFRLEEHLHQVYAFTILSAHAVKIGHAMRYGDYDMDIMDPIMDRFLESEEGAGLIQEKLDGQVAGIVAQAVAEFTERARIAEQSAQEAEKARKAMQEELKRNREDMHLLKKSAEKEQSNAMELSSQIEMLRDEIQSLQEAVAQRDRLLEKIQLNNGKDGLPPLPESGILFVGGHPNLTGKLRELHPGWAFIEGSSCAFQNTGVPKLVLFWDGYMSHKAWHKIRKLIPSGTPQAYLKSTNLDMLGAEMRRAWAMACDDSGEGEA